MGKSSPEKREASPICGRALLRWCPAHFLLTAISGILGGFLVAFILEFPSDGLWAAAYWSTSVYGFWIFTTSLLVLWSEKRYVACIGSGLYIFFMFFVTTVYMSLRFSLKTGEYVYRITAEWQNGNRAEYGFAGWGLPTD